MLMVLEASTAMLSRKGLYIEVQASAALASHLPELKVLPLLPRPGVGPLTGAGQSVHHLLVQDRHSQIEYPHYEDDHNAGECSQLKHNAVRPNVCDGGAQQAVPAAAALSGAVHGRLWVCARGKESLTQDAFFFCL